MLTDFASATMVRSRGLVSMSPPPARAATVSSLMMRVKTLPRLASAAPFLCLMVCHLEWPDMFRSPDLLRKKPPSERSCYHETAAGQPVGEEVTGSRRERIARRPFPGQAAAIRRYSLSAREDDPHVGTI